MGGLYRAHLARDRRSDREATANGASHAFSINVLVDELWQRNGRSQ